MPRTFTEAKLADDVAFTFTRTRDPRSGRLVFNFGVSASTVDETGQVVRDYALDDLRNALTPIQQATLDAGLTTLTQALANRLGVAAA